MVRLGNLAIDGTKMKANASRHKAMSYDYMGKEAERLGLHTSSTHRVDHDWRQVAFEAQLVVPLLDAFDRIFDLRQLIISGIAEEAAVFALCVAG